MREIKFRAWDADNYVMYYSDRDEDNGEGPIVWDIDAGGVFFEEMTMLDLEVGGEHEQRYQYMRPIQMLMQYTGLKDCKGKEIYDGDMCVWLGMEVRAGKQIRPERVFQVKWSIDCLFRLQNIINGHDTQLEVIGNIYEAIPDTGEEEK